MPRMSYSFGPPIPAVLLPHANGLPGFHGVFQSVQFLGQAGEAASAWVVMEVPPSTRLPHARCRVQTGSPQ